MGQATDFLKLIPLNDIEPNLTWEQFCQKPYLLLKAFAENFAVEGKFLQNLPSIIFSGETPQAADRSKIWIKTTAPYAIGVFLNGLYQMQYFNYQINVPFLADKILLDQNPVQGVNIISPEKLTEMGIADTTGSDTTRWRWYLFDPGDIEI